MKTTLNEIRKANPCESGWEKLLKGLGKTKADDEPLSLQRILEINDIDDACWVAEMVLGLKKELRLFAYSNALCVKKFIPKMELKEYNKVINTVNLYVYDEIGASAWASASASARASAMPYALYYARASAWASAWASAFYSAWASASASTFYSAWDSASYSASASALDSARCRFIKTVCNGNLPKKVTSKNHF